MYLFVFVVLISSILGLYTQLYMLQTSKMMAKQSGIAGIMLDWHGGAYNHAKTNNITSDMTGCLLTSTASPYTALPNGPNPCSPPAPPFDNGTPNHKWYTIVYLPPPGTGTQNYMVTFARPPASGASDPIAQPAVGYAVAEIWSQIKKSGAPKTNYGRVQANGGNAEFITPDGPIDTDTNRPHTYRLPACATTAGTSCIPIGSVGFITPL